MLSKFYCSIELSKTSSDQINSFLKKWGVSEKCLFQSHHLTIYEIPLLKFSEFSLNESKILQIHEVQMNRTYLSDETRFMVMSPGGDNPKNKKSVHRSKIGIRFTKRSALFNELDAIRKHLSFLDNQAIPLTSSKTGRNDNAYGIKRFIPHITLINRNNNLLNNLYDLGAAFREHLPEITFSDIKMEVK